MNLVYILDLIGTFVFAISGFLAGANKKLDLWGATVLAFITAIGGGTIRDILLDSTPVSWMQNSIYLKIILAGAVCAFLFKKHIIKLRKTLFLFDTIGIGVFTVIGTEKALMHDCSPTISVIMGVTSAVMGGVIRDTLNNDIPLIFKKEIYATACIVGGAIFVILNKYEFNQQISLLATILIVILIRVIAIKKNLHLPTTS